MIVNNKDAAARLASPMNLMNRLKDVTKSNERKSAMSLFIKPASPKKEEVKFIEIKKSFNPFQAKEESLVPTFQTPQAPYLPESSESIDNIMEDHEAKIQLGLAHDKAVKLLNDSVAMLATKLDDIKADRLPQVISAASKTIESIRSERNEVNKNNKSDREVHYHFYTPNQRKLDDFEVIEVTGSPA